MPTINPSDDPALSGPSNDTTTNTDGANNDPATNNYQNLFHDSSERGGEDVNPMQLDVGHEDPVGRNDWSGGGSNGGVTNGYDTGEAVPPLPPPLDDSTNSGGEVVLIPNTVDHHGGGGSDNLEREQQREQAIVVEGEIIGPMPQQRQEQEGAQLQAGVPVETVQLWEEVAFGLEKNQTGKCRSLLDVCVLMLIFCWVGLVGGEGRVSTRTNLHASVCLSCIQSLSN